MKYRHIGMAILFVIAYFGLTVLVALVGFDPVVSTIVADLLMSVLCVLYMRHLPMQKTDFHYSYVIKIIGLALVTWLFSQITATYVMMTYNDVKFEAYQETITSNPIAFLILSLVVAPVLEELLVRGVIYNSLKRAMPIGFAYLCSSIVFAALHGTLVHLFVGIVCGLLFAVVYEYTGNILYSIGLHMLYNSLSIILGGIVLPDFLFHPIVFGIADAAIVGFIIYEMVRVYRHHKGVPFTESIPSAHNS